MTTESGTVPEPSLEFLLRLLRILDQIDCRDELFWRTPASRFPGYTFFIDCSDLFSWGTSDLEEIHEGNIEVFEGAVADLKVVAPNADRLAPDLFCARMRKMRPQAPWYRQAFWGMAVDIEASITALFNDCGPSWADQHLNTGQ